VSANILDAVVGKVMSLLSFAWMLYSISPSLVLVLLVYSAISTLFLSGYFGASLAQLNRVRADLVGRLRLGLLAVRTQSEGIAFFRAEEEEKQSIDRKSRELSRHDLVIARAQRNFALLDYAYNVRLLKCVFVYFV
jgi:putative ATP-binding cassette transporter